MPRPRKQRQQVPTDVEFYRQWALKLDIAEDDLEGAKRDHAEWWASFNEEAGDGSAAEILKRYLKMRRRLNSADDSVRGRTRDMMRLEPIVRQALGIDDQLDAFEETPKPHVRVVA